MTHSYLIAPKKLLPAFITAVFSMIICITMLFRQEIAGVLLFLAIGLLFGAICALYGAQLTIDESGIHRSLLGIRMGEVGWEKIKEVGVVGTSVFQKGKEKNTGIRFIYFSEEKLDENKRFRLAMEWPPRKMFYLEFDRERLDTVQMFWNSRIAEYNAGDLFI